MPKLMNKVGALFEYTGAAKSRLAQLENEPGGLARPESDNAVASFCNRLQPMLY
jgi:hypothetical protein